MIDLSSLVKTIDEFDELDLPLDRILLCDQHMKQLEDFSEVKLVKLAEPNCIPAIMGIPVYKSPIYCYVCNG